MIDEVTFKPVFHSPGYNLQICEGNYHNFYFSERTYFPPIFSDKPIQTFYEFWPEDGKAIEYKNSQLIESAYEAGRFGIMFVTCEEMIDFLDYLEQL